MIDSKKTTDNEAVWRNGGSSPQKVQCDFGSLPPARSSVEAATTPSRCAVIDSAAYRNAQYWSNFVHIYGSLSVSTPVVTQAQATLQGKIASEYASLIHGFAYKQASSSFYTYTHILGLDTNFSYTLTGLQPNTHYQFCTFAVINNDTVYSAIRNFTTLPVNVTTLSATEISQNSVVLQGSANAGDATLTSVGFKVEGEGCYAQAPDTTFIKTITNLSSATQYHYKAFAICGADTAWGASKSFITAAFERDTSGNFLITNADELSLLSNMVNSGDSLYVFSRYKLMNDIVLPDMPNNITPIGKYDTTAANSRPFCGIFDGNGKLIHNLNIDQPTKPYQGLFGYTKNAFLYNVGLVNINVIGRNYTGGIVAYAENTNIQNSYVNGGLLFAVNYIGGLVGYQSPGDNSFISGCYNTGQIQATNYVGGILGYCDRATVRNSYVAASVTGQGNAVGGIIGAAKEALIYYCYYNIDTTGQYPAIGNIISKSDEGLTTSAMLNADFVNKLNYNLSQTVWRMDYNPPINHGFPVLVWQNASTSIIEETVESQKLVIYPNPAIDQLHIKNQEISADTPIEIFNMYGQQQLLIVRTQSPSPAINVSHLPAGMYIIRIGNYSGKFIKQ